MDEQSLVQSLQRQPECIADQEYEDDSGDGLDDMFGVSSQHPQQFTSTNHDDSQDSRRSQVRVSVCYIIYVVLY